MRDTRSGSPAKRMTHWISNRAKRVGVELPESVQVELGSLAQATGATSEELSGYPLRAPLGEDRW